MLKVLGIGTGVPEKLTLEGFSLLQNETEVILQTGEIPLAAFLVENNIHFTTLDAFYEEASSFDDFTTSASAYLKSKPDALFCVLGDLFTNTLLQQLVKTEKVQLYAGASFAASALSLAMPAGSDEPIMLSTAADFLHSGFTADCAIVITEVDSTYIAAEISSYLQRFYAADIAVCVVQQDMLKKVSVGMLQFYEDFSYDTCIVVPKPAFTQKQTYGFRDFCAIVKKLRSQEGCPWDREQTHKSLRASLIEECYEAVEAIDMEDPYALADELGDVLLQVVLHAQIASEHGEFDVLDICDNVAKKMIRRHPHVFGDARVSGTSDVLKNWEAIKKEEKQQKTKSELLQDIPTAMGPLMRAQKLQKKAASFGFDWPDYEGPLEKVQEELNELMAEVAVGGRIEEEAGDLLFAVVNLLRKLKIEAEIALFDTCKKFTDRIGKMEKLALEQGKTLENMDLSAQDALWQAVKCEESM